MCEDNIMRKGHRTKKEPHINSLGSESVMKCIRRDIWLYAFLVPALIYLIIFKYAPMLGMVIGFKDYSIGKGILGSRWVGFDNFIRLFKSLTFLLF